MSLSWAEEIRMVVRQHCIELGRFRRGRLVAQAHVAPADPRDLSCLEPALATLGNVRRWRLLLGGWAPVHGTLAWREGSATSAGLHDAARADLRAGFGLDSTTLELCLVEQGYGRACLYWAIEKDLVQAWQQFAAARQADIVGIESLLFAQLSRLQKSLPADALLIVQEDGLLHLLERRGNDWLNASTTALPAAKENFLALEQRLRLATDLPVLVCAPGLDDIWPSPARQLPLARKHAADAALASASPYLVGI